ncbi:MAG: TetR/AcrR family transcriptional regulator [Clostridia bacterium]|nr:TetR/AcrR family transcriptional regulator [Clostridia bacterium]
MAYKTPKEVQERKDEKKRQILITASRVFASRGYHNTAVKDIVDEAGISVGSFYFYFKNKEDLFETLYDEATSMILNSIRKVLNEGEEHFTNKICKVTVRSLFIFNEFKNLTRIMMIEAVGLNPNFEHKRVQSTRRFSDYMEQFFESLKREGHINFPDIAIASTAYIGTIYNVIMRWLQESNENSLTEYAYPLIVYNLQALNLDFSEDEVRKNIRDALVQSGEMKWGVHNGAEKVE